MGSSDAAAAAAAGERLALGDRLAFLHIEGRQMHVEREQAFAVVEDDEAAFVVHVLGDEDLGGVRRDDGGAGDGAEIEALVGGAGLAVVGAAGAEGRGLGGIGGR